MLFGSLEKLANRIAHRYEKSCACLTDIELKKYSQELKRSFTQQSKLSPQTIEENVNSILPSAFALVREAAFRELGYRHYKEQLMAGIALYRGYLVQMQTGEGKTLAITAPAFLAALTGYSVHIVTANEYLAVRDCANMGGIYNRLGISCSVITPDRQFEYSRVNSPGYDKSELKPCTRQAAYSAPIIYGTAGAFGFDYLRDHLVLQKEKLLNPFENDLFTILDEADNILLDEARTPLIISTQTEVDITQFMVAFQMVRRLQPVEDYKVDRAKRVASFTDRGISKLERWYGFNSGNFEKSSLYDEGQDALFYLDNCLKALTLYNLNEDYLILPGKGQPQFPRMPNKNAHATYPVMGIAQNQVDSSPRQDQQDSPQPIAELVLIDQLTGRTMPGRRLGGGLHEALEVKEGLVVKSSNQTMATISLQSYFKNSKRLAGLSGTLETDKAALHRLYGLETIVVPTHKPVQRIQAPALVFRSRQATLKRLVQTAIKVRESGAPVLIGTPTVQVSEEVSAYLKRLNVPHQVLNARQNEKEARIVARAGYPGRITVATNMAGRGTDIQLGGRYADHLEDLANQRGLVREADEGSLAWRQLEEEAWSRHARAREIVYREGGLHVLGLGLQTSRRLDQQLVGRAGRQGDPGYAQFFYSLEDELVVKYAGKSGPYQHLVSGNIPERGEVLPLDELSSSLVLKLVEECQRKAEGEQLDILKVGLEYDSVLHLQREIFYRDRQNLLLSSAESLKTKILRLISLDKEEIKETERSYLHQEYTLAEHKLGQAKVAVIIREAVLKILDKEWMAYLTALEELRQGISLRAFGAQKPLQAFQVEGRQLWDSFQSREENEVIKSITNCLNSI